FNDTATTEIYTTRHTLSLHDALPISQHVGTAGESPARAGVMLATFAYALWVIIVAFMGGAGWALAHSFATADAGMTATRAAFVFDMLRPFALDAQRVAGFALGLATANPATRCASSAKGRS